MKPIDLTLLAVTAGVGFMLFSLSRKVAAANSNSNGYLNWLSSPQPQNQVSYIAPGIERFNDISNLEFDP
jgi:hypothetical protein